MGCFLACFGSAKDRKRRRSPKKSLPLVHVHKRYSPSRANASLKQITPKPLTPNLSPRKPAAEAAADTLPELKENLEQGSFSRTRKRVTFDLNVTTYEEVLDNEDPKCSSEDDERTEAVDEERKPHEGQDESSPKSGAFPLKHRYQNCESSDDDYDSGECGEDEEEEEEEEDEDSDFDEEEDNVVATEGNEEESYDSFFSLAIDKEPQSLKEVNSPIPKCLSSPDRQPVHLARGNARDRSQYVHSVLNPVENLSQWKEVKVRAAPAKNPKKETIGTEQENHQMVFCPEPMIKVKKPQGSIESDRDSNCSTKQEISVDASLSNWLLSLETSTVERRQASNSHRSNLSLSREERPILGALTIEDIKQSSVTSSPRKSPSRSLDEIPIVGTVGRYWNCMNQGDDSASSYQSGSELKGLQIPQANTERIKQ